MKKQIVFIHGGNTFDRYEDHLEYLRTREIENPFEGEEIKKWKYTLREALGDEYEIAYPSMPSAGNAKYEEWRIWFERYFEFLRSGVILIGHSQGGYFLAKYLSENTMPVSVKALFLVAAPVKDDVYEGVEAGGGFGFDPQNLPHIEEQAEKIIAGMPNKPTINHNEARAYYRPSADLVNIPKKELFLSDAEYYSTLFHELAHSTGHAKTIRNFSHSRC